MMSRSPEMSSSPCRIARADRCKGPRVPRTSRGMPYRTYCASPSADVPAPCREDAAKVRRGFRFRTTDYSWRYSSLAISVVLEPSPLHFFALCFACNFDRTGGVFTRNQRSIRSTHAAFTISSLFLRMPPPVKSGRRKNHGRPSRRSRSRGRSRAVARPIQTKPEPSPEPEARNRNPEPSRRISVKRTVAVLEAGAVAGTEAEPKPSPSRARKPERAVEPGAVAAFMNPQHHAASMVAAAGVRTPG